MHENDQREAGESYPEQEARSLEMPVSIDPLWH